jgi:iron only hydrogenase large subunit-like protein
MRTVYTCLSYCSFKRKEFTKRSCLCSYQDKNKYCCQVAPAVRATLGEEYNIPLGTDVTGQLVTGLRRLGFKKVFDTNFAADLTIIEEAVNL